MTLETLSSRVVRILMATGSMEWDLPAVVRYHAGDVLTVGFTIANPTDAARQYSIYLALFDLQGSVIPGTSGPIALDGQQVSVPAGEDLLLRVQLRIDYSNCIMQAALYDVETGEMGTGLQATLEEPPELGEQLAPLLSGLAVLPALGLALSIVGAAAKEER